MSEERIFIVAPEARTPSGGRHYLYLAARLLREHGADARILHQTAGFQYTWFEENVPIDYEVPGEVFNRTPRHWPRDLLKGIKRRTAARRFISAGRAPVVPTADDIVLLPETHIAFITRYLPARVIIFNQNGFYLADMIAKLGGIPAGVVGVLSTSELSERYAASFGFERRAVVPYVIDPETFRFAEQKKREIVYMPRKRGAEAAKIARLLQIRGKLRDFKLVPIDGVSRDRAAQMMHDALILISLSEREGFGLPPAEAMSTGSIVVGYTGHGGREFFTDETGRVSEDGDTLGIIEGVERVVSEYSDAPTEIDVWRREISRTIQTRYSMSAAQEACGRALEEMRTWRK